jgi:hypothetical protein
MRRLLGLPHAAGDGLLRRLKKSALDKPGFEVELNSDCKLYRP